MSHPFHEYLCQRLAEHLGKRRIVVFYDPREEFTPLFDRELEPLEAGKGDPRDDLPRVAIGGREVALARFDGSFFRLRAAAEPVFAAAEPALLLLYLPGVERDREGSLLMELETAGECYEPTLRQLARHALRQKLTDGQIDPLLAADTLAYEDVVAFFRQAADGRTASVLRSLYPGANDDALLAEWLVDDALDERIESKGAAGDLRDLVAARLGFELDGETPLAEMREKTLRYVLIGELRSDLDDDPPKSLVLIPAPRTKTFETRLRDLAARLRRDHPDAYLELADRVETELDLAGLDLDPAHLGSIDTFRFEEKRLLGHANHLVAEGEAAAALEIVEARRRSFWIDRDVLRQAQWQACRWTAELARAVERAETEVGQLRGGPEAWIHAYTAADGWHHLDTLRRTLESRIAAMEEEPEAERALHLVRRAHEKLLEKMAEGFTEALEDAGWNIPDRLLRQTHVYREIVDPLMRVTGRVAYVLVDALRFEMGLELLEQLKNGEDMVLRPAIAALPTITPVGMAALLPGASASFSVVEHQGKLAAKIEETILPGWSERRKLLAAKRPDMVEMVLGELLGASSGELEKKVEGASLVVVRSQEIDALGETDHELLARHAMDSILGNLARAIRKLARAGVEGFVVAADHGYQFTRKKAEDMRTDHPGGKTAGIHRRAWAGHGGTTPPGTVRVTGAELGYATDLDFVFPRGLGVFKTGGSLAYHHGGTSLQELVVPVLSLRLASPRKEPAGGPEIHLRRLPARIDNRTFGVDLDVRGDLFSPDTIALRPVLLSGGEQVGRVGLALDAELDQASGVLEARPGTEVTVGFLLTRDDIDTLRVAVLDPATDALLAESPEIPVKLEL